LSDRKHYCALGLGLELGVSSKELGVSVRAEVSGNTFSVKHVFEQVK